MLTIQFILFPLASNQSCPNCLSHECNLLEIQNFIASYSGDPRELINEIENDEESPKGSAHIK